MSENSQNTTCSRTFLVHDLRIPPSYSCTPLCSRHPTSLLIMPPAGLHHKTFLEENISEMSHSHSPPHHLPALKHCSKIGCISLYLPSNLESILSAPTSRSFCMARILCHRSVRCVQYLVSSLSRKLLLVHAHVSAIHCLTRTLKKASDIFALLWVVVKFP